MMSKYLRSSALKKFIDPYIDPRLDKDSPAEYRTGRERVILPARHCTH
jgi:hypothetical protein